MTRGRTLGTALMALLGLMVVASPRPAGAYFAGGGKDAAKGNDCLIGYDGVDPDQITQDGKKYLFECTDCDPSCDRDGVTTPNNACTIEIGACINQGGVEGCTPPSGLDKAKGKGKVKGVKGDGGKLVIEVPQLLEGSACGALIEAIVPVKETKKGLKDGKASISLQASVKKNKTEGTPARSDKDKLTVLCKPLPEGESCPIPTTTSTTVPTTTTLPSGTVLRFTTGEPTGTCGVTRAGGSGGTLLNNLSCGGLNIGGGAASVPEGPTPQGADTFFNTSCTAGVCTVSARTSAETGTNNNCSDVGCVFGPWLSIFNSSLSTCVQNTFGTPASGTLDGNTGEFNGAIPLSSAVTLTGNGTDPCPPCMVGGVPGAGAGTCNVAAANPGAACVGVNVLGDTYDCLPAGFAFAPFGVDLDPATTGQVTASGPTFCPGQGVGATGTNGCFGDPTCDYIEENGSPAGTMTPGAHTGTLASIFCIPAVGNVLIDGAADLPGPGATSLPGTFELIP